MRKYANRLLQSGALLVQLSSRRLLITLRVGARFNCAAIHPHGGPYLQQKESYGNKNNEDLFLINFLMLDLGRIDIVR